MSNTQISNNNGKKKVNHPNSFFITDTDILEPLKNIKIKNCKGFDRIHQRILVDGANCLIKPLKGPFIEFITRPLYQSIGWLQKLYQSTKKVLQARLKITDQLLTSAQLPNFLKD